MEIGDRVITEQGGGILVDFESYERTAGRIKKRWGVKLDDKDRFNYCPAYYWPQEMKIENKAT